MKNIFLLCVIGMFIPAEAMFVWNWLTDTCKNVYGLNEDHIRGMDALKREEEYKKQLTQQSEELIKFRSMTDRLTVEGAQKDKQIATMKVEWEFKSGETLKMKQQTLTYQKQQVDLQQESIDVQKKGNKIHQETNTKLNRGFEKLSIPTVLQQASQIATIATGAAATVAMTREFVDWVNPSQETLTRKKHASQMLKYTDAEEAFNKCFFPNRKSSAKNADGVPFKCEEAFEALLAVIGSAEGEKLKESLKSW